MSMKRVAIMQPYLFPYIGYFQLINSVDEFIIYDDVQWIKSGWINRNRILSNGDPIYFTLPVKKGHIDTLIFQKEFVDDIEKSKNEILKQLTYSYKDAPYYHDTYALIEKCFNYETLHVSDFLINTLRVCTEYLKITTELSISSHIDKTEGLRGQEKLIDLNKRVGAKHYINPIGGQELYNKDDFKEEGISLSFIKTSQITYSQYIENFVPWLSIVDVMMFNSVDEIKIMLDQYELV